MVAPSAAAKFLSALMLGDPKAMLEDDYLRALVNEEWVRRVEETGELRSFAERHRADLEEFLEIVNHPEFTKAMLQLIPAFKGIPKALLLCLRRFPNLSPKETIDELAKLYPEEIEALKRQLESSFGFIEQEARQIPLIPEAFPGGYGFIPSALPLQALEDAIKDADEGAQRWVEEMGKPAYRYEAGGGITYITADLKEQLPVTEEIKERLWEHVRGMTDLTADVLFACLAQWVQQTDDPRESVWITADKILDYRGIRPKYKEQGGKFHRAGHRKEDREAIAQAIQQLDHLWLDMVDVRWRGRRFRLKSKALIISAKVEHGLLEGGWEPYAWKVWPGEWGKHFLTGPGRQVALLAQKALEYDPYREDWEKRLARYFAFQWRIRATVRNFEQPFKVKTLLAAAHKEPDHYNPRRTLDRLEGALDRLQADGVVRSWHYKDTEAYERVLQTKKGWLGHWLEMRVWVEPPEIIKRQCAILRERILKLPAAGRKRQAKERPAMVSGEAIRKARQAQGMAQRKLAKILGITQAYLSQLEGGQRTPSPELLRRIQAVLKNL